MIKKFKFCYINWKIFFTVVKQDVASSKSVIGNLNTAVTSKFCLHHLINEIFFLFSIKLKFEKKFLPASTAPSSIGKIPASCGDLQQIGHKKSGLYSVMGSNKIQTVYCDFTKSPSDSGMDNSKRKLHILSNPFKKM